MTKSHLSGGSVPSRLRLLAMAFAALAGSLRVAHAADAQENPAGSLFTKYCRACHAGEKPKADFRIEALRQDFSADANRRQWLAVLEQLQTGAMPPEGKPRPPADDVKALVEWIGARLKEAEAEQGRVVLRRLNRAEYVNTVRDLLGVEVDLTDLFPAETSTSGFDNNAEALHVSSYLMENYLAAADRVLDAAIASGPRPPTIKKRFDIKDERTVKPKGSVYRHVDDGVAIFSSWVSANIQVTLWQFQTRGRGQYRFRISGYGYQTEKPVTFHVMAGPMNAAAQQYLIDYFDVPANQPTVVEFVEPMESSLTIRIITDGLGVTPPDVEKVGAENYKGPGLVVQWVDVEGPLIDSWPPESHRRLFGDLPQERVSDGDNRNRREVVSRQPMEDAARILKQFTRRAFRRTVTDEDIEPFLARVRTKLDQNNSFEQAMRAALKAVMLSPHFLFLPEKPGRLDDFALASRLSYFLWSSMPDEELLTLAEQGKLSRPETLHEQVERLLRDPRSSAFTTNFVGQWLSLRAIDATTPDRMLYPEYDDILKDSMVKEVILFFDEVLKNDLSLTNFAASDFSMLNGRLAIP
jgi:cytochrome c5